jgi:predicted nucleic acid-binding protein
MTYLLDTDWVISFLNGRADAVAFVKEIAATALAHDLTLVSRDGHFSRVLDLRRYEPRL